MSTLTCGGIVYRADVQHCKTVRGVIFSVRLNKMKRMSCPGCEQCGWLEDNLDELRPDGMWIIDIEKAVHNKLYTLSFCNMERDFKTGNLDTWDLRLTDYIEKQRI